MKKLLFVIVSLLPITLFAQTQINSISPTTGPAGTSVTITGSGFNTIADSNFVYFNDSTLATVTAASSTSLTVTVPTTSSNGPIKVINNNHTDFSDQYFTYPALTSSPPPIISSYSPLQAQVGDVLTINGNNFSTVPGNNSVHFGSVKAQVISSNTTQINVYVPAGLKYDYISVTVARQTCFAALPFEVTFPGVDSSIVGPSFSNGITFSNACGMSPYSRGFIDIDGDGKQDLCNTNYGCFSISRNTSTFDNFSFAPPVYTSAGGASADIDGDGKIDFIKSSNNSFLVSKNTSSIGNISFRPAKAFYTTDIPKRADSGGSGNWCGVSDSDTLVDPTNISVGDIDGDGKPDLAVSFAVNCWNGFYAFYRNTTNNGIIDFSYALSLNGTSYSTALRDLDGDGKPDVIAPIYASSYFNGNGFYINRNTSTPGNISFAPRVTLEMGQGNFTLADINNDGKLDIVMIVASTITGTFQVSLNQSTVGNISFAPPVSYPTLESPHVVISDLDGDGKPDAAVFHYPTPHVHTYITIFKNTSVGTTVSFDSVSQILVKDDLVVPGAGIITCDVDMDGKPEIIAQYSSDQYSIYRNKANEPSIDSLDNPSSHLPIPGGTKQVVIKGDRFLGATSVTFNGVAANSFIVDSKDQITAIVDTTAAATMKVRVETPLGIATLPTGSVSAPLTNFCTHSIASIIFKGDNGIPPYKFQYKINNGATTTVTSGPGDSAIVHMSSSSSGTFTYSLKNVTDIYGNGSKNSINKTAVIKVVTTLPAPTIITGPTNVTGYIDSIAGVTYTTPIVSGASSYTWTVPLNATILSGQGSNSIQVTFTNGFCSGNITVKSVFSCGNSAIKALAIIRTIPSTPGAITGPTNACPYIVASTNANYSIAAVAFASSYNWTVPTGATIVSGQGTTSLTVNYAPTFVSGNISVQSVAGCTSAFKTLAITKTAPAAPTAITGPNNVCIYMGSATNATYSVAAISGVTSYTWTVPTGASIVSGQGTTSVQVSYTTGFASGSVTVKSVSVCGTSVAKSLTIIKTIPTAPLAITGVANVCPYIGSATNSAYSIVAVAGASSYTWTVPAGATIVSGQGTTSISVSFSSSFVPGNLTVKSVSGCGSSAARTLALTRTIPAAPTTLTGLVNVCPNVGTSTNVTYTAASMAGAISYFWTVPSGATIMTGQGTHIITVRYSAAFVPGNISVQSVANCGSSAFKTLAVTRTIPGSPTVINGPTNVCSYVGTTTIVTYSTTAVAGAATYVWTVPTGVTIVSGQNTASLKVKFATSFSSGNITVLSHSNCGNSAPKMLTISKTPIITDPISGPTAICFLTTATYSITSVSGATSYTWILPPGISPDVATTGTISNSAGITTISGTTNSINVNIDTSVATTATAIIKVAAVNSCGTGSQTTLSLSACRAFIGTANSTEYEKLISNIYPNPSGNFCTIDFQTPADMEIILEIFDVSGKRIITNRHIIVKGASSLTTDISELTQGSYLLKITDIKSSEIKSQTFIKQ